MLRSSTSREFRSSAEPSAPPLLIGATLALVALSIQLAVNLLTRSGNEIAILTEVLRMREVVRQAETRRGQVQDALSYAATDAFTEYYARAYLRWARPGETVVVPATPPIPRKWLEEFVK